MVGVDESADVGGPLRSFRERNVRIYFGGIGLSSVGTWAHNTAVILLVRELGGGGLELGISTACQFGPFLLFGLYAGAIADRTDRFLLTRRLQTLQAVVALSLAATVFTDIVRLPIVYALTLAFGTLSAFDNPARRTFMTELVPAENLGNILSLSTSVMTGSRMFGPAIAAIIATTAGTEWVFLLNGVSYLAFLLALTRMDHDRFHPIERDARSGSPIRDALRAIAAVPLLRVTLSVFAVTSLFAYNHLVAIPLLVRDRLGADDSLFGWLLSAMSAGNVLGALAVARLHRVPVRAIFIAGTGMGVALCALALTTSPALAFVIVVPFGICSTAFVNASTITVQQNIDPRLRSRALAFTSVLFVGSTPIGGVITGVIGDTAGALWAALYGGIAAIASMLLGAAVLARRRSA